MAGSLKFFTALAVSTALIVYGALAVNQAFADPPSEPPGQNAEPCHGSNDEGCRDDPQPDRGRDCTRSEDHVCDEATEPDDGHPPPDDGDPPGDDDPPAPPDDEEDEEDSEPRETRTERVPSQSSLPVVIAVQQPLVVEVQANPFTPPSTGDGGLAAP